MAGARPAAGGPRADLCDGRSAILRAANALFLIGLLVALRRLGFGAPVLAVAGFNPMLYFYFIVQAHNDLPPMLLVVAGMAIARRRPVLGAFVAGAAGLVKIASSCWRCSRTRGGAARRHRRVFAAVLAAALAVSAAFGGSPYFHAMREVGRLQIATGPTRCTWRRWSCTSSSRRSPPARSRGGAAQRVRGAGGVRVQRDQHDRVSVVPGLVHSLRAAGAGVRGRVLHRLPAVAHAIDPHFSLLPSRSFALLVPYYLAIIVLVALALRRAFAQRTRIAAV